MNKKITALSTIVLVVALALTVINCGVNCNPSDVSYASLDSFAVEETASTTMSLNDFVSGKVDSVTNIGGIINDVSDIGNSLGGLVGGTGGSDLGSSLGGALGGSGAGIGDAIGGIGDALGGLLNNSSGSSGSSGSSSDSVTYDVNSDTMGYIDIVPAATEYASIAVSTSSVATTAAVVNETVDFAATQNPYTKPTGELKGGDRGDGVKWMQWVFIYTRYGLKDDGITGVFDEDTMAVVKKLQRENGMNVDGIVDDEVIDKIDLLYYQAIYSTTAPATLTQATEAVNTTDVQVTEKNGTASSSVVALLIVVILLWIIAIVFIVVIIVIKKKKASVKKKSKADVQPASDDNSASAENPSEGNN